MAHCYSSGLTMTETTAPSPRTSGLRLFLIVFTAVLLALLLAALAIRWWLFPARFEPVALKPQERIALNEKLHQLGYQDDAFVVSESADTGRLEPRPYSEAGPASREVRISERELNALLAKNTDLAQKLAIDLADGLASARLVVPLPPDFPFLGGQTLRMSAGVEAAFTQGRPILKLRGVSVWGVPLPNAWLGDLKNVDLVAQFGDTDGFWRDFAAGIDALEVREGSLFVRLSE